MTADRAIRKRRNYYKNLVKRLLDQGYKIEDLTIEINAFRTADRELVRLRYIGEQPERFGI